MMNHFVTWPGIITLLALLLTGAMPNLVGKDLIGVQDLLGTTTRISMTSNGTEGNDISADPSISGDGRYVVFHSNARNLVNGDTNNEYDVFIHDRQTGQTTCISVNSNGLPGNAGSYSPAISPDGRYVAFESYATDLVSNDTNGIVGDVLVRDRQTGQMTRVSLSSSGMQGNADSYYASISTAGRYVAFKSDATNLVSGDINGVSDVFVHDRQTGQTIRVSVASDGMQGNGGSIYSSLSADGRYVAFDSSATNLVSGDTNGVDDVFVHDRQTGQTTRVSVASNGTQGNGVSAYPFFSADGRYVAFYSEASNLVSGDTNNTGDVFVRDLQSSQTTRVSLASDGTQGNNYSYNPSPSTDGRYVAFTSAANNLISGDTNDRADIFVRDQQTGQITRVSLASDGAQGNLGSYLPSLSADGRYVAFESYASNLVSGDTNGYRDVFVYAFPTSVYLPIVLKPLPTNLHIKNDTTGAVSYTVTGTPEGTIICSNIPAGTTRFCGSFTPGTYTVRVDTAQCGSASGQVTFPPGNVTRAVSCQ